MVCCLLWLLICSASSLIPSDALYELALSIASNVRFSRVQHHGLPCTFKFAKGILCECV